MSVTVSVLKLPQTSPDCCIVEGISCWRLPIVYRTGGEVATGLKYEVFMDIRGVQGH